MNAFQFDWQTAPLSDANAHYIWRLLRRMRDRLQCAQNSTHKYIKNKTTKLWIIQRISLWCLLSSTGIQRTHQVTHTCTHAQSGTNLSFELDEIPLIYIACNFFMTFAIIWKGFSYDSFLCVYAITVEKSRLMKFMDYYLFIDQLQTGPRKNWRTHTHFQKAIRKPVYTFHFFRSGRHFSMKSN